MSRTASQLSVSLEIHLVEALQSLFPVLPSVQQAQLEPYLSTSNRPSSIPYALLQSVSQWARSTTGQQSLQSASQILNPNDYSMIALLAGATTSPGSKFPPYQPSKGAEEIAQDNKRERRAIGIIVNAVFSIVGTGGACWWGSKNTGWKLEWRVLFAFLAAMVVALAEIVLYILWQQRQNTPPQQQKRFIRIKRDISEVDDTLPAPLTLKEKSTAKGLRLRNTKDSGQDD
ncbi:hypothetical protein E1B28_007414 [Marasmius oreades]|uniref:Uncharacterized protein n=1 Tax=Marasmius oreades TaxID=181124 RepID=A0A9P7UUW7_9AGAR|nr:uncharacterized protein E1B28_007414 [Marasmius oreades]KAG7093766.1 hypothetical protein E1B28_007414 [Marasmius oreades]